MEHNESTQMNLNPYLNVFILSEIPQELREFEQHIQNIFKMISHNESTMKKKYLTNIPRIAILATHRRRNHETVNPRIQAPALRPPRRGPDEQDHRHAAPARQLLKPGRLRVLDDRCEQDFPRNQGRNGRRRKPLPQERFWQSAIYSFVKPNSQLLILGD